MDTWVDVDFPVLKAAVAACSASDYGDATCDELIETTGLDRHVVLPSVVRLSTRYLRIRADHGMADADYKVLGVTAAGLEITGVWPNPELLQERIVAALERLIEETPAGSPKALKLGEVLAAVKDLVLSTSGNVFGQIVMGVLNS